jgi:hypothetical protein
MDVGKLLLSSSLRFFNILPVRRAWGKRRHRLVTRRMALSSHPDVANGIGMLVRTTAGLCARRTMRGRLTTLTGGAVISS